MMMINYSQVATVEASAFAAKIKIPYIESSAKQSINVSLPFEAAVRFARSIDERALRTSSAAAKPRPWKLIPSCNIL